MRGSPRQQHEADDQRAPEPSDQGTIDSPKCCATGAKTSGAIACPSVPLVMWNDIASPRRAPE